MQCRAVAGLVLLLGVGLAGCSDSVTAPIPQLEPSFSTTTVQDTIWGSDNVLQVEDEYGDVYRLQRFGTDGAWTHVDSHKNGVFQGRIDLTWSGGSVVALEYNHPDGHSMTTDADDGGITDTYVFSGGFGGCVGGVCQESNGTDTEPLSTNCADGVLYSSSSDCSTEYDEMQEAAVHAAADAGVASVFTWLAPTPIGWAAVLYAGHGAANALGKLGVWAICKVT